MICKTCAAAADEQQPRDQHCDAEPGAPDAPCFCQHRTDRYRTKEQP